MLDSNTKTALKNYLERLVRPIEIVTFADDSENARQMLELVADVASVAPPDKLSMRTGAIADERVPSFQITRTDADTGVRFAGLPLGHEFNSLLLALLQISGYPPRVEAALIAQIKALDPEQDLVFETYMSLSCHHCPDVVQAFNLMATLNPKIRHTAIEGSMFKAEGKARQITGVPCVYLNGQIFLLGAMALAEILVKIETAIQPPAVPTRQHHPDRCDLIAEKTEA
jgi:NADH-dependent peroxiredoxin subunit F